MTTTYHLQISGGALSVVVIAERCYGPCQLSDDNNNNNNSCIAMLLCLQHEELVLLLIQLRRSQTKLEEMRVWVREKLTRHRPEEKAYRIQFVLLL